MSYRRSLLVVLGLLAALLVPFSSSPSFASGTVTVAVSGQGSVSGTGIDCNQSGGPDCSEFYADDSYQECDPALKPPCRTVTTPPNASFTAGADSNGYVYDGWTGCDSVSDRDCLVTVNASLGVTARFRDAQAPTLSALSPSGGYVRGTVQLTGSASDNSGSVAEMLFSFDHNSVGEDTTAPYAASWNTVTGGFDGGAVTDGPHTLNFYALDPSSNMTVQNVTVTVDNTAPTLDVSGPDNLSFGAGSTQQWAIAASDATSGVTVACSLTALGAEPSFGPCSDGDTGHAVSDLPDGSYVFAARATDGAGNVTTSTNRAFLVDTTAPQTTIKDGPAKVVRTRRRTASIPFAFKASEPVSGYRCKLDGKAWQTCAANPSFKVSLGKHVLWVEAIDRVGNRDPSPATRQWTVRRR